MPPLCWTEERCRVFVWWTSELPDSIKRKNPHHREDIVGGHRKGTSDLYLQNTLAGSRFDITAGWWMARVLASRACRCLQAVAMFKAINHAALLPPLVILINRKTHVLISLLGRNQVDWPLEQQAECISSRQLHKRPSRLQDGCIYSSWGYIHFYI